MRKCSFTVTVLCTVCNIQLVNFKGGGGEETESVIIKIMIMFLIGFKIREGGRIIRRGRGLGFYFVYLYTYSYSSVFLLWDNLVGELGVGG